MAKPRCVIFLHIPKTGGQTLNAILTRQYGSSKTVTITDSTDPWTPFRQVRRGGMPVLIRGHFPYGVHDQLDIDPVYITILRHPVDRVVSVFRYIERHDEHPLHGQVHDARMSLSEFVTSGIDQDEVEDGQTRQLAGPQTGNPDGKTLARAKSNLQTFAAISLTQRFDEGLILFRRKLGWRMPFYVSKNVAPRGGTKTELGDAITLVEQRNALDLELYRWGRSMFNRQIDSSGWFKAELTAFQTLNRAAQLYRRLR